MTTGRACGRCPNCSCATLDAAEFVTPASEAGTHNERREPGLLSRGLAAPVGMSPVALGRGLINARVGEQVNFIGGASVSERTFTRSEVVAIIRAAKANEDDPFGPGRAALERLRRTFEVME